LFPFGNPDPTLMKHWSYLLQVVLLTGVGLHLVVLAGVEVWQKRDTISVTLALWILSGFLFATVLNWTISARSLLPIIPAAAILGMRRLERYEADSGLKAGGRLVWPLIPSAIVGLSLVYADYESSNSVRAAARQFVTEYKTANKRLWFEGHGGFQYYMEKLGGEPINPVRSLLQPGDIVVVNCRNDTIISLVPTSVGPLGKLQSAPSSWMNLAGSTGEGSAGFYSADWGPIPFMVSRAPPQVYYALKVYFRMQFRPRAVPQPKSQVGGVRLTPAASSESKPASPVNPSRVPGSEISMIDFADNRAALVNPEVQARTELASQLEKDGKFEEALQQFRETARLYPDDPIALNNLAWALAANTRLDLRNGQEAVRLANRAIELTSGRQPLLMGTLAVAYAQAGQFSEAVEMAQYAHDLAFLTGQSEVAAMNEQRLKRYSLGNAVDASGGP